MTTQEREQDLCFEEDAVFTAQKYLRDLANGRDPMGGNDLSEDHVLRDPSVAKALSLSADLLEGWLSNGGFNARQPKRERPFQITRAQREKIRISEQPIVVSTLANNITKVLPYDMKTVRYSNISNWLQYIGALEWEAAPGGTRRRVATPMGEELGIKAVDRRSADGMIYKTNVFDVNAQHFIIDNLEGIMTHKAQMKVQKAAEKVEKAKEELEAAQKAMEGEGHSREKL